MVTTQPAEKPVVYILHGDDQFAIKREVEKMHQMMGDPGMADLNTTRFDGRQASDEEIRSAANALPFLTDRRLVIVTSPFSRTNTDAARKRFLALLDGLPPSTALVLIVEDVFERSKWKLIPSEKDSPGHWIRKWLKANEKRSMYKLFQLPSMSRMPEWVREEARRQGGQIQADAAGVLVEHIGNNPQQASLEIAKLLTYVDFKRPVEVGDVEELTAQAGLADVFAMVDAMALGNTRQALLLLRRLLETQEPLAIFALVIRQFRLLIQAREVLDEGRGASLAAEIHQHPFVADKLSGQARRFQMPQLERIYHRLLEIDEALKTSQIPGDLALETLVVEMGKEKT